MSCEHAYTLFDCRQTKQYPMWFSVILSFHVLVPVCVFAVDPPNKKVGSLGVKVQPLAEAIDTLTATGLPIPPTKFGVVVIETLEEGPMARAELGNNVIITHVKSVALKSEDDFVIEVEKIKTGHTSRVVALGAVHHASRQEKLEETDEESCAHDTRTDAEGGRIGHEQTWYS